MGKGKRYDSEPKLNMKKVFGVIITIAVIIMIILSIIKISKMENNKLPDTKTSYFTVYTNEKWGVIDNTGKTIINPIYEEMVIVPNKETAVFICAYDINDETGEYKTKALNEKNELILSNYSKIEAIENYDSKQNVWYENNILRVYENGKYGLIDFAGNRILNSEYDEIIALKGVTENFIVRQAEKVGLVNSKGQEIIPVKYKEIKTLDEDYKSEYIIINENNQYGIISTSGTTILEPQYEELKYVYTSDAYAVKTEGVWKLVSKNGEILLDSYENYTYAKGDNVIVQKDGKYGIATIKAETKVDPQYDKLEYAFSIYYIAQKEGKYGIININGETIINFDYLNMYYIEEGNIIVADKTETETVIFDSNLSEKLTGIFDEINTELGYIKGYINGQYKYYNFKFEEKNSSNFLTANTLYLSKKDGKYGYVDKTGQVVVDYIYDDAKEQNSLGYCAVKKDGLWGSLGKDGRVTLEPSINLDNNLYMDFIGEWHLSNDRLYYEK